MAHTRCICPSCDAPFKIPATRRNKVGRCPRCGTSLVLTSGGSVPTVLVATPVPAAIPVAIPAAHAPSASDTKVDAPEEMPRRRGMRPLACSLVVVLIGGSLLGLTIMVVVAMKTSETVSDSGDLKVEQRRVHEEEQPSLRKKEGILTVTGIVRTTTLDPDSMLDSIYSMGEKEDKGKVKKRTEKAGATVYLRLPNGQEAICIFRPENVRGVEIGQQVTIRGRDMIGEENRRLGAEPVLDDCQLLTTHRH